MHLLYIIGTDLVLFYDFQLDGAIHFTYPYAITVAPFYFFHDDAVAVTNLSDTPL